MKRSIAIFILLLCSAISYCQPPPARTDFKKLFWLEGSWIRTNAKQGYSGKEQWFKISPTQLRGTGINMKGADTVFVEKFQLIIKGDAIYYVADVPENKGSVDFKLTEISDDSFTCENPYHDFPKMIHYRREGNTIKATISGNGKSRDYLFERKII